MSEEFKLVLDQIESIRSVNNIIFLVLVVLTVAVSSYFKDFLKPLITNTILVGIAFGIADIRFFDWWETLKNTATSTSDKQWIADQESKISMAVMSMGFKAFSCWLVGVTVSYCKKTIKKNKEKAESEKENA